MSKTTHVHASPSSHGKTVLTVETSAYGRGAYVALGTGATFSTDRSIGQVHLDAEGTRQAIAALEATLPEAEPTPEPVLTRGGFKVGDRVSCYLGTGTVVAFPTGSEGETLEVEVLVDGKHFRRGASRVVPGAGTLSVSGLKKAVEPAPEPEVEEPSAPEYAPRFLVGDRVVTVSDEGSTDATLGALGTVTEVDTWEPTRDGYLLTVLQDDGTEVRQFESRYLPTAAPKPEAVEADVLDLLPEPSALPLGYALEVVRFISENAPKV